MKKTREEHLRKSLFRHLLPKRATSTDFSLSATPFHFFSPSTSGMGTARHRLIDRGGPRGDVRQPAASQRVQDGHAGRWSSCLRNSHFILNRISKNVEKTQRARCTYSLASRCHCCSQLLFSRSRSRRSRMPVDGSAVSTLCFVSLNFPPFLPSFPPP